MKLTENELQLLLLNNPDLSVAGYSSRKPVIPREQKSAPSPGHLAVRFEEIWRALSGEELVREYCFAPPRRWRFDYAHLSSKVAIEINGGVWMSGRHVRGKGYIADREKINAATALGWAVFELTPPQIKHDKIATIVEFIKKRAKNYAPPSP